MIFYKFIVKKPDNGLLLLARHMSHQSWNLSKHSNRPQLAFATVLTNVYLIFYYSGFSIPNTGIFPALSATGRRTPASFSLNTKIYLPKIIDNLEILLRYIPEYLIFRINRIRFTKPFGLCPSPDWASKSGSRKSNVFAKVSVHRLFCCMTADCWVICF